MKIADHIVAPSKFVKDNNIGMDADEMANRFTKSMDTAFKKWKPAKRYVMEEI